MRRSATGNVVILSALVGLAVGSPCAPNIPYQGGVCSGHGKCTIEDAVHKGCVCDLTTWTGSTCDTISNHYMFPTSGPSIGGTKIAFVVFDFEPGWQNMNLDQYRHNQGQLVVSFVSDVDSSVQLSNAYVMNEPWHREPGKALGWAATAPTFLRNYGEGYHVYDDLATNPSQLPKNMMPDGIISNGTTWAFEVTAPQLRAGTYTLKLQLHSLNAAAILKWPMSTKWTSDDGLAFVQDVQPRIAQRDGTTSLTLTGEGFSVGPTPSPPWTPADAGKAYPPLHDLIVQLSIGPGLYSTIHDPKFLFTEKPLSDGTPQYRYKPGEVPWRAWWPARKHYYPRFTVVSSTKIIAQMTGILWPLNTANTTIEVAVTKNRQNIWRCQFEAFYSTNAAFKSILPSSLAYLSSPSLDRWRPRTYEGMLVPRTRSVKVCVQGQNIVNSGVLGAAMIALDDHQGDFPAGTFLGKANGQYVSSSEFCFYTPGPAYTFTRNDYPKQLCQSRASSVCECESWSVHNPDWGYDGACCMRPKESSQPKPWCYCKDKMHYTTRSGVYNGEKFSGMKDMLPLWAECDLRFAPQMTFRTDLLLTLNRTYGDYIVHPLKLYHYEDPVVVSVRPQNVSFWHMTNLSVRGHGFIDSSSLAARVYINGSHVPIPINITYHSPYHVSVIAPSTYVHNVSISSKLEFSLNGQDWHLTGSYVYGIPVYYDVRPANLEIAGGVSVTISGGRFMPTQDIGVRLRTKRGLSAELLRLQGELSRQKQLLADAKATENSLRQRATLINVWDATELRRMELEAFEHVRFLEVKVSEVEARVNKALSCLSSPTYTQPAIFVSKRVLTFKAPPMCLPDVHVFVEVDVSHNVTVGDWGYQMDVLSLSYYDRLYVPSGDPPQIFLERGQVRTERGAAEIGTFDMGMDQNYADSLQVPPAILGDESKKLNRQNKMWSGSQGQDIGHTEVCKYLYRAKGYPQGRSLHEQSQDHGEYKKDRYNGKGVHDSDPHFQVPPHFYHQLHREQYVTLSRSELPDWHGVIFGGQQQLPNNYHLSIIGGGEVPTPREVEKQCNITTRCTVWQDSWQQNWTLPNMTYEVVHCYKIRKEPLISDGKRDGYLKKFNSSGGEIWSVRMGGIDNDHLRAMTADRWGNLYIIGDFLGSNITFDSKVLKQMVDTRAKDTLSPQNLTQASRRIKKLLIAKYNSGGEFVVAAEVAACFLDGCTATSISVDDFGNVYITGEG